MSKRRGARVQPAVRRATAEAPASSARGSTAARLAAIAALGFVAALQVHSLDDGDTWWHLASGRLIAASSAIAHADPFSFTAPGAPWLNRQWLFDLATWSAWRLGGSAGVVLAAAALFVAAFGLLYLLARRRLPAWAAAALVVLGSQVAVERFTVRPEAMTFCLLAVYLLALDGPRLDGRILAGLVALQVLWANVHALSILGVGVLGAELAGACAARWLPLPAGWRQASARDPRTIALLGLATAAALAAETATPFGVPGALFPLRLLGVLGGAEATSRTIIEHQPPVLAQLSPPVAVALVVLLGLTLLAAALGRARLRVSHLLTAGAFVVLALMARRNVALLAFGALPLVATGLAPAAAAVDRRPRLVAALGGALALGSVGMTAGVVSGAYYDVAHLTRTFGLGVSGLLFPGGAVDFLDAHAGSARLYNDDGLGGYLLWRDYPKRRVFIDGRVQVYPGSVYGEYLAALEDVGAFSATAARWGITAVLLYHPAPGRLEAARAIAGLPGWRIAYVDGGGVVLLADGQPPGLPAGLTGPGIEHPASATEEALARYQRGRAVVTLLGRQGFPFARADFEAALHLWPALDEARQGLALTR